MIKLLDGLIAEIRTSEYRRKHCLEDLRFFNLMNKRFVSKIYSVTFNYLYDVFIASLGEGLAGY